MTKHTPATPLPWKDDGTQIHGRDYTERGTPTGAVRVLSIPENFPYIAHAANAYPRLVERAKARAAFLRLIVERMPKDARMLYEDALGAEAASDEALLRELGEI